MIWRRRLRCLWKGHDDLIGGISVIQESGWTYCSRCQRHEELPLVFFAFYQREIPDWLMGLKIGDRI